MRRQSFSFPHLRLAAILATLALVLLAVAAPVGAATAPKLVKDINPSGDANPTNLTQVGSTLFFAANDGVHGVELWKSDGTLAGTKMVKNIRPYGKSSNPQDLVNVNGTLFFTAVDGAHGRELWKSDGTKAGTVMVKDINPGPKNQFGGNSTYIYGRAFSIGSRLFFMRDTCCLGTQTLNVSDGTAAGTRSILQDEYFELPEDFSVGAAGGKFYFVVEGSDGEELFTQLWVSDGTVSGTHPVPGAPTPDDMSILPAAGQYLYFATTAMLGLPPAPAFFVWRTDGTLAGTKRLTDNGELDAIPTEAVLMNGRLFFNGGALWKTNGTAIGTKTISDGQLTSLVTTGSRLFFNRGSHLWRSDGTSAGTRDIAQIGVLGGPSNLTAVGTKVCFTEYDWENDTWWLWEGDGTLDGLYAVKEFVNPVESDTLGVALGSGLFFAANDGVHGAELWSYTP